MKVCMRVWMFFMESKAFCPISVKICTAPSFESGGAGVHYEPEM